MLAPGSHLGLAALEGHHGEVALAVGGEGGGLAGVGGGGAGALHLQVLLVGGQVRHQQPLGDVALLEDGVARGLLLLGLPGGLLLHRGLLGQRDVLPLGTRVRGAARGNLIPAIFWLVLLVVSSQCTELWC